MIIIQNDQFSELEWYLLNNQGLISQTFTPQFIEKLS